MIPSYLRRLRDDDQGSALIEFAFVAPVLLTFIMAGMDVGYRSFITSTLQGAVQKAGRDSALESGAQQTTIIDNKVKNMVKPIVDNGTFTFERKFYSSLTKAGQAENFTDTNNNGVRNPGECFDDENGNGVWDTDGGRGGQGGAKDIVVYTAKVSYPRLFPIYGMLGWSSVQEVKATTVLRNQPYGTQATPTVIAICT
jgi:Flp pilus assembly pilin Flp